MKKGKKFNLVLFARQNNLSIPEPDGRGWINMPCPCCDDDEEHMGFNTRSGFFHCWRCGWHPADEVISKLMGTRTDKGLRELIGKYETRELEEAEDKDRPTVTTVRFPTGTAPMLPGHRRYLLSRGFSPNEIEEIWDVRGTGPIGDYNFRIVAPIYLKGELVSYQARDITDRSPLRYKACPLHLEKVHHKHTVYGIDLVPGREVIVVEGITDAWKIGPGTVSTFGTSWKMEQAKLLAQFKRVFLLFDSLEIKAQRSANELGCYLCELGCEVELIRIPFKDPGEVPRGEGKELACEVFGKRKG